MLTLIKGPPGSGKTHFLGAALNRKALAARASAPEPQQSTPLRILVVAFTHEAINHVLKAFAKQQRAAIDRVLAGAAVGNANLEAAMHAAGADGLVAPVWKFQYDLGPIEVGDGVIEFPPSGKSKGMPSETTYRHTVHTVNHVNSSWLRVPWKYGDELKVLNLLQNGYVEVSFPPWNGTVKVHASKLEKVRGTTAYEILPYKKYGEKKAAARLMAAPQCVIGSTVYQLPKLEAALGQAGFFDVVVVDEASQMLLTHFTMALHMCKRGAAARSPARRRHRRRTTDARTAAAASSSSATRVRWVQSSRATTSPSPPAAAPTTTTSPTPSPWAPPATWRRRSTSRCSRGSCRRRRRRRS